MGRYEDGGRHVDQIWKLHSTPDGLYAAVSEAGLFRSDDSGESWQPVFDETGSLRRLVLCFCNQEQVRGAEGLARVLETGDSITIMGSVAGGRFEPDRISVRVGHADDAGEEVQHPGLADEAAAT